MLATIVYAINPKQDTPVEGFTAYSPTPENALRRKDDLIAQITSGSYKRWSGQWRIDFVDRCRKHGWEIVVKNAMIG
jgi:hypothetical protein